MFEAHLKRVEPTTVAYLTMTGSYEQTPHGFGRLYAWIGERGLTPTGPPAAVYLTPPGAGEALWELWAPIAEADQREPGESGIGVKRVAACNAASTMYQGPYEGIEQTYRQLEQWVTDNGYTMTGPPMELYFSDPNEVPPEEYLTEILFPVS